MKIQTIVLSIATAGTLVAAQPHRHQHRHPAKRAVTSTVDAAGPVVTLYELNGSALPASVAESMIAAGELVTVAGGQLAPASVALATPTSSAAAASSSAAVGGQFYAAGSSSAAQSSTAAATSSASSSAASSASNSTVSGGEGLDLDFPDGELDCTSVPTAYGALAVDYLGMGGWAGIQCPSSSGGAFDNIRTLISGQTPSDGCYAGYACPAGYLQQQWPSTQGATGQSVGGLLCKGGKLYKSRSESSVLCKKAESNIYVESKLTQVASICRTLYPGTEAEVIPLAVDPNETEPLACPDSSFYQWEDKVTSAQYYVNPEGLAPSTACQWSGENSGNDAPVVFGVGTDASGKTWLSITNNAPTNTDGLLGYKVTLVGDDLSDTCYYENGHYCGGSTGCNSQGCTVQVVSGSATYVLS